MRLDVYLVTNNYFKTRSKAQLGIKDGIVYVNDKQITKTGFEVSDNDRVEIKGETLKYVSRGGLKLEKALQEWHIDLTNKIMIDIGSSTGGFSDVAIQNGIAKIYAIDVGTDQFDKDLAKNPIINLYENTDFREMDKELIKDATFAAIDVSFISVTKIIPKFLELPNLKEIVCLIKPQFECGMEIATKFKGVIKDENVRQDAIKKIVLAFNEIGYNNVGVCESPIKGGDGNIEYLAFFTKG
ncbi:MAG: TlyA family RNA methyltransferase [Clostridia bacterium]|nr:TlyA family RNA methyltransferase [Clostridia bacterium]